jgi:hypothetical protein
MLTFYSIIHITSRCHYCGETWILFQWRINPLGIVIIKTICTWSIYWWMHRCLNLWRLQCGESGQDYTVSLHMCVYRYFLLCFALSERMIKNLKRATEVACLSHHSWHVHATQRIPNDLSMHIKPRQFLIEKHASPCPALLSYFSFLQRTKSAHTEGILQPASSSLSSSSSSFGLPSSSAAFSFFIQRFVLAILELTLVSMEHLVWYERTV